MTTSYTQRYLNGDCEGVWKQLRALGPVPPDLAEDCAGVAAETMRRVRRHVVRLAELSTELGMVPRGTLLTPPVAADLAGLHVLTDQYYGLEDWQLPDPLVLPDVAYLRGEWDVHAEAVEGDPELADEGFAFEFAPDDLNKSNISGACLTIALPSSVADPVLYTNDDGTEVTLVDELRWSIAWGGMPGWSFGPAAAPAALAGLRVTPDF
ncbi:hypothetical protein ACFRCI_40140 [Streptomyces sp. NPDC056638]|uniref:hypothetical protein n=1 Tax=Streptomyces sp. NPDC056638 TaxID=3345887 RepID=UPI0036747F19